MSFCSVLWPAWKLVPLPPQLFPYLFSGINTGAGLEGIGGPLCCTPSGGGSELCFPHCVPQHVAGLGSVNNGGVVPTVKCISSCDVACCVPSRPLPLTHLLLVPLGRPSAGTWSMLCGRKPRPSGQCSALTRPSPSTIRWVSTGAEGADGHTWTTVGQRCGWAGPGHGCCYRVSLQQPCWRAQPCPWMLIVTSWHL